MYVVRNVTPSTQRFLLFLKIPCSLIIIVWV